MPRDTTGAREEAEADSRLETSRIPEPRTNGRRPAPEEGAPARRRWPTRKSAVKTRAAPHATLTPNLDELIAAYKVPGRPQYDLLRKRYQGEHGRIRDTYFAKHITAGALIVKPRGLVARLSQSRLIVLRYDGLAAALVQPDFEAAIWRTRALERESALVLGGRSRKVLIEMIYTILVYLLGVLDATSTGDAADPKYRQDRRRRVESALHSVRLELNRLERFKDTAAKKASLRWYLLGLPVGAVIGFVLVALADTWSPVLVGAPSEVVKVCFACGAVGGVVSVMARITRGQGLVIDSEQGHVITLLAGAFRPLIGSVFGLALYVFVQGGLVPISVPAGPDKELLFFAALSFLSGFSERWAQDTIVKSTPVVAAAMAPPGPHDIDKSIANPGKLTTRLPKPPDPSGPTI
jgi:hypothetical protein